MSTENSNAGRRWYDQKPELTQCVRLIEAFPTEVRSVIAEGVSLVAEREFQVHLLMNSLRSLGPEKVLGLYKSKNRRRLAMDSEPLFHKTMNYLFVLSPENRDYMARLTTELVSYIYRYFESCKIYLRPSSLDDIRDLTDHYVRMGPQRTQEFLEAVQQQFRLGVETQPASDARTILAQDGGMRIRGKHGL